MAQIRYIKDENEVIILPVTHERGVVDSSGVNLETKLAGKQATLVSGTNIKTINNQSILGSGNITVQTTLEVDPQPTENSENPVSSGGVYTALTSLLNISSITSSQDGSVVFSFTSGDTVTIDLNHNHTAYYSKVAGTTQPSGGFLPDVVYNLGTLTGTVTFTLASAVSGNVNHYFWMFDTSSTAPTVTWPSSGFTWADGTGPTVAASKHYEISVLNGIATFLEA